MLIICYYFILKLKRKVPKSKRRIRQNIRAKIACFGRFLVAAFAGLLFGRKVVRKRQTVKKLLVLILLYHTKTHVILCFLCLVSLYSAGHVQRQFLLFLCFLSGRDFFLLLRLLLLYRG